MEFEMLAIWIMAIWYNQNSKLLTYDHETRLGLKICLLLLFAPPGRERGREIKQYKWRLHKQSLWRGDRGAGA